VTLQNSTLWVVACFDTSTVKIKKCIANEYVDCDGHSSVSICESNIKDVVCSGFGRGSSTVTVHNSTVGIRLDFGRNSNVTLTLQPGYINY